VQCVLHRENTAEKAVKCICFLGILGTEVSWVQSVRLPWLRQTSSVIYSIVLGLAHCGICGKRGLCVDIK